MNDHLESHVTPPEAGTQPSVAAESELAQLLQEFFSELMGIRSSYGLDGLGNLDNPAEADAIIRLRLRIAEHFLARGWSAPPSEAAMLDRDRDLLEERAEEVTWPGLPVPTASVDGQVSQDGDRPGRRGEHGSSAQESEVRQMRQAMESRAVIEQAKGIAMARYQISAQTAWSWLVRESQQRNVKL